MMTNIKFSFSMRYVNNIIEELKDEGINMISVSYPIHVKKDCYTGCYLDLDFCGIFLSINTDPSDCGACFAETLICGSYNFPYLHEIHYPNTLEHENTVKLWDNPEQLKYHIMWLWNKIQEIKQAQLMLRHLE